ncbi:hypothetical protein F3087_40435 [Nocardia colli]|uniref:Uncharacterized protein n=1 Tax=Nocardia colli TaxID=2545717 RepID=A0A5N0DYH0_9NOCA|nr:hypothetical protein [Nocardia colli]KAA8880591.1 hypothetical protein F3087_40435 [Nocardia colli]
MGRDYSIGFEMVVQDLQRLSAELAQIASSRIRAISTGLDRSIVETGHADLQGRHIISGVDIATGETQQLGRQAVLSMPMVDGEGHVVGVQYPREPKEIVRMARWAAVDDRTSDRTFYLLKPQLAEGAYGPKVTFDDARPAPWTDPLYIQAHGSGTLFNVLAGSGNSAEFAWRMLRLDHVNFARLLGGDQVFRDAARTARSDDVVLLTCATAAGPAARTIADHLHNKTGIDMTVHGFTGKTLDGMRDDGSVSFSQFGVYETFDSAGDPIDPVRSYPRHAG